VVAVRVVAARAHDRRLQIVVANDARYAAKVAKRPLMESQERFELLIPDRLFVAVARVPQRHPKHPGPPPLAGRRLERGRAGEEVDLRLGAGGAMEHPDDAARPRDRAHEPLDRLVARAVAVLLDEVLPDALDGQSGIEFFGDDLAIVAGREPARAGKRLGRV